MGCPWSTRRTPVPTVGNKISRFDPETHEFEQYPLPDLAAVPMDLAIVDDDYVYFSEQGANKLGRIDVNTHEIETFPYLTPASQVLDIDPGPNGDGTIWFAQIAGNNVGWFDPKTEQMTEIPTPSPLAGPFTIAEGADGGMYYTQITGGRVARVDPGTKEITEVPIPSLVSAPGDIACEKEPSTESQFAPCKPGGSMWFTEVGGSRVGELEP